MSDTVTTFHVSTDELRDELEQVLALHFGAPRPIRSLRRRRSRYSSSYPIESLDIELTHGKRLRLVFKDLSPNSLLEAARDVRPSFLYNPTREIDTYRTILRGAQLGTPVYYGSAQHPVRRRYWLFLERVDGPLLWQVGSLRDWKRAARWLARLHSRLNLAGGNSNGLSSPPLLRCDAHYLTSWIRRAEKFVSRRPSARSDGLLRKFRRLADRYDRVVERLLALPQSFIHGEFYPANIIMRGRKLARRVCPIDWESAAIGPSLIDLAALTSGKWTCDQRRLLVASYRETLARAPGWPPSLGELMELVDLCHLHLSVQWLGWAADWVPPRMHAHDWLREAVGLSSRLQL